MQAGGVPRIHRRPALRPPPRGFRSPLPGLRRTLPRIRRRLHDRLRRPSPTPRRRLGGRLRTGRLLPLILQTRPGHLPLARLRPTRTAPRRHPGNRIVLLGTTAADVPLFLRTVESPLPRVVGNRLGGGVAPTRLGQPAAAGGLRVSGPPATTRPLVGGPPTPDGIGRTPTAGVTRPHLVIVVIRRGMPTTAVDAAYARLQRPTRQVRLLRLLLATLDGAAAARGAVTLHGGVVLLVRGRLDGIGPRSGRPTLARAIITASPVPVTHGRSVTLLNRTCNPLSRCSRRAPILRDDQDKALPESYIHSLGIVPAQVSGV